VGARREFSGRNIMTGPASATGVVSPLGGDVNRLARLLAAGCAIGMAETVGADQINTVERALSSNPPEIGEIHLHLFLEVDVLVESGDAVVVIVLSCVGVTLVATDGVSAAVTVHRQQVLGVATGAEIELIAVAPCATQSAVFIPTWGSELDRPSAGVAIAVTAQSGASAVAAVVTAVGVEAIEEHILEAEGLGDMAGVGGIRDVVAGAALDAILASPVACVFFVRHQVLVQTIGGVTSGRWG